MQSLTAAPILPPITTDIGKISISKNSLIDHELISQIMKERKQDKIPSIKDDMTPSKNFIGISPDINSPGSINIKHKTNM